MQGSNSRKGNIALVLSLLSVILLALRSIQLPGFLKFVVLTTSLMCAIFAIGLSRDSNKETPKDHHAKMARIIGWTAVIGHVVLYFVEGIFSALHGLS